MITNKIAALPFDEVLKLQPGGVPMAATITTTAHLVNMDNDSVLHAMALCMGSFVGSAHAVEEKDLVSLEDQFVIFLAIARRTYEESYKSCKKMIQEGGLKVEGVMPHGKPS